MAATGRRPSDATTLGGEAGNGQSRTKTMKTLAASAVACAWKKRPINCTTKEVGVTPAFGMFGAFTPGNRQSFAGGGNRASPEAGNGQSRTKTTKTLAASAAACAWKKRPINCTTKEVGVTPAFGMSENPRAVYTAAQYLEAEEQQTEWP